MLSLIVLCVHIYVYVYVSKIYLVCILTKRYAKTALPAGEQNRQTTAKTNEIIPLSIESDLANPRRLVTNSTNPSMVSRWSQRTLSRLISTAPPLEFCFPFILDLEIFQL
uniref:LD07615p n=1 Tax=Drosophila melanogaster TaxID=7227 RepID=Q8SZI4_DROME|nr:LD07615p [Drosophila melanogaster]